jgi:flagellar basal body-associated protein FliL
MTTNEKAAGQLPPSKRRARRLRMIGVIVLVLGIAGAGILYWLRTRSPDVSGDLSMQGFNRAETRQMGQLYGKQGLLIEQWSEDLKQSGTQAVIIVVFSTLITAGCFYFARLMDDDETG